MSESKRKTSWFGAFANLFRPEPDMVSLEKEVEQLRAELARREQEALGKIAVYENDLVALAEGVRVIQERCSELEDRLEQMGRERSATPVDGGGSLLEMGDEEDGW